MKLNLARCSLLTALFALGFALPALSAAPASAAKKDVVVTHGSGSSTITDFTENPDGTDSIVADQEGTLSGFGPFTGTFSYLANIDPNTGTTLLTGQGLFKFANGDQLFVDLIIVEVGLDYPKPYAGVMNVTGGTGRFANAQGFLVINGSDGESFTDPFQLHGELTLAHGAKK
jgi:hypothetical protein